MSLFSVLAIFTCLLTINSVSANELFTPVCLNRGHASITLLGVAHDHIYKPSRNGIIEKLIARSNLVLIENTEVLPINGIFSKEKKEINLNAKPFRLAEILDAKGIVELSKLFGVDMSPDLPIGGRLLLQLPDGIMAKKLLVMGHEIQRNEIERVIGQSNMESAAYSLAYSRKIATDSIESASDLYASSTSSLASLKSEIRVALECTKSVVCMDDFRKVQALQYEYLASGTKRSYDDYYQLLMKIPSFARYSLPQRNIQQFKKIKSFLTDGIHALVIVGAAHVGGPIGLAAKFENAGFVSTKCPE